MSESKRTYYAKRKIGGALLTVSKRLPEVYSGESFRTFRASSIREANKLAIVWHNLESERERARRKVEREQAREQAAIETAERRRRAFDRRVSLSSLAAAFAEAFGEDPLFLITSEARSGKGGA